jgi:hypothetical protein
MLETLLGGVFGGILRLAPVDMPTDGQMYSWDEATTSWTVVTPEA